jgi:hypothetical protein
MGRTTDQHGKLTNALKECVAQRLEPPDAPAAGETLADPTTQDCVPRQRKSRGNRMSGLHERGKLSHKLKEYVVQRLAAYDTSTAIVRSLLEEFGIKIRRCSIEKYDPTKHPTVPKRWRELFVATRQAILEGKVAVGAASAMVRLRWRDAMAREAIDAKDFAVADRILNSAAKDAGDSKYAMPAAQSLSDEDRLRALLALVNKVNAGRSGENTRIDVATDQAFEADVPPGESPSDSKEQP